MSNIADHIETLAIHPVTGLIVAGILAAIALSGKLSVTAARVVLFATLVIAIVSFYRFKPISEQAGLLRLLWVMFIGSGLAIGAVWLDRWMSSPVSLTTAPKPSLPPNNAQSSAPSLPNPAEQKKIVDGIVAEYQKLKRIKAITPQDYADAETWINKQLKMRGFSFSMAFDKPQHQDYPTISVTGGKHVSISGNTISGGVTVGGGEHVDVSKNVVAPLNQYVDVTKVNALEWADDVDKWAKERLEMTERSKYSQDDQMYFDAVYRPRLIELIRALRARNAYVGNIEKNCKTVSADNIGRCTSEIRNIAKRLN